jgi:hypothetical protein
MGWMSAQRKQLLRFAAIDLSSLIGFPFVTEVLIACGRPSANLREEGDANILQGHDQNHRLIRAARSYDRIP